jgi:phenylpropionate dioxygenase-like ring-hydroxylating dioxygenase large terminal subunit
MSESWNPVWNLGKDFVPKGRYLDREFFELELERFWPRVWQIACRLDQLAEPGRFFEYTIGDQSILLVRVDAQRIKAFFNSCRHRGTRLASGCGRFEGGRIRCPFHGWTWKLDGANATVFLREEFAPIPDDELRLRECKVDTWGGFVFINMDPAAPPLAEAIGPATRHIDPVRLDRLGVLWHKVVELPINWKGALEAFTESYHVPATHPEYPQLGTDISKFAYYDDGQGHSHYGVPLSGGDAPSLPAGHARVDERDVFYRYVSYTIDEIGAMYVERDRHVAARVRHMPLQPGQSVGAAFMEESYAHAARIGIELPKISAEQAEHIGGNFVFPNFFCLPLVGNCLAYRSRPNGMDHSTTTWDVWSLTAFSDDAPLPPYQARHVDWRDPKQIGRVLNQDFSNMLEVSQGMRSRGFEGARLNLRQEGAILSMHQEIDRYLRET